jgi:hypothetical protein
MLRSLLSALLCVTTIACGGLICFGCGDTIVNVPTAPTPTPTATPTPAPAPNVIAFRVIGNPTSVRVRYSTPVDGLGQVITTLPYFNTISTTARTMFLSLEATPTSYPIGTLFPFLSVQIVVNDQVFREATSQDFLLSTLSVSGTWRQ